MAVSADGRFDSVGTIDSQETRKRRRVAGFWVRPERPERGSEVNIVAQTAEPIAVVGAGAIGMTLGAALARAGHPLTVCGGTPVTSFEVTENGRTEVFPVVHTTEPADVKDHRLVLLAVKAHQTPAVADWLQACSDPQTVILIAQNGVEHLQRLEPYRGESALLPSSVFINSDRPRPGAVTVRRSVSDPDVRVPDIAAAVRWKNALEAGGMRVSLEPDFVTTIWLKLMTNLITNPITALTLRRLEVLNEPGVAAFVLRMLRETVAVARAEGATIAEDQPERTISWITGFTAGGTTSMLQDRLAGRALEHDAITGAVVRAARRHGLPVPHVESVDALVSALDARTEHPVS